MAFVLNQQLGESDLEFLGEVEGNARFIHAKYVTYLLAALASGTNAKLTSKYFDEWEYDGWRDFTTGDRILSSTDRMVIMNCPEESLTSLKLKYLDKLVAVEIQYE